MTDTTPLPCPFCNGEAIIIHEDRVWIECADCPSKAEVGPFNTRAEALTAWNTRAVNSHHDLIEALRDACEALSQITNGEAFREMRFAEDDDAEYHLRRERKAKIFARDAAAKIDAMLTKAEAGHG